jgi:hypothetical protein
MQAFQSSITNGRLLLKDIDLRSAPHPLYGVRLIHEEGVNHMPSILNTLPVSVKLKGPQQQITHLSGHGDVSIQQTRSLPTMDDVTLPPQVVKAWSPRTYGTPTLRTHCA